MGDLLQKLLLESQRAWDDVNELIALYERDRLSDIFQNGKPNITTIVLDNFPILTHDDSLTTNCVDVCKQIDHDLHTIGPFLRHTIAEENSMALTQAEKDPYLQDTLTIANQRIPYITFSMCNIIRSHDPSYDPPTVGDQVLTYEYKSGREKNIIHRHGRDYVLLHKIRDYIQKLIRLLE